MVNGWNEQVHLYQRHMLVSLVVDESPSCHLWSPFTSALVLHTWFHKGMKPHIKPHGVPRGRDCRFAVEELGVSFTQLAGSRAKTCPLQHAGSLLWPRRKGTLFQPPWSRGEEQDRTSLTRVLCFWKPRGGALCWPSRLRTGLQRAELWGVGLRSLVGVVCWGLLLCQVLCQAFSVHDLIWLLKQPCEVIIITVILTTAPWGSS